MIPLVKHFFSANLAPMQIDIKPTLAAVQNEKSVAEGASVLLKNVKDQLKLVFAGVILPAEIRQKVDALFEVYENNKEKLGAVLTANTLPPILNRTPPTVAEVEGTEGAK
jgi:hypothetical protein